MSSGRLSAYNIIGNLLPPLYVKRHSELNQSYDAELLSRPGIEREALC